MLVLCEWELFMMCMDKLNQPKQTLCLQIARWGVYVPQSLQKHVHHEQNQCAHAKSSQFEYLTEHFQSGFLSH